MRVKSFRSESNGPKLGLITWPFLLYILLQSSFALASPLANAKRDNDFDQLMSLFRNFISQPPIISQAGTNLLNQLLKGPNQSYSITQNSKNPVFRSVNLDLVRLSFQYGDPVGGGPYYPSGLLGVSKAAKDVVDLSSELTPELALTGLDAAKFTLDAGKYNNLQTLDDYVQLYNGEFQNTAPAGTYPGVLTNYTEDLLFSMQRLSSSPYQVRRLKPDSDNLLFTIPDNTASQLSGLTLQQLFQQGRLFYADYRDQLNLTTTSLYTAACDAYFYIHATSGDFLPLAIRTNVGSNLIYTPLDASDDWLLAKIMFNVNDFWFSQWNHLAATHEVVQIVWSAAIRSISQEHPVYALLNRLTYQVFSIPVAAEAILFPRGGAVDLIFPFTGDSARSYSANRYKYGGAGQFQGNYFTTNLKNRGLLGSTSGPALKNFPFFEDGSVLYSIIRKFIVSFVGSYYSSDAAVAADREIQNWVSECNGAAKVIDFPTQISTISALVDALTHIAHLGSISHHTVNTNELIKVAGALPFCPLSLYSPPPTTKGTNLNVADFLPKVSGILESFTLAGLFARPLIVGSTRTMIHMFDDQAMLGRMNTQTQNANTAFIDSMKSFSVQINERTFGSDGLSQGMPFVWKALDPNVAPYSVTT